MVIEALQVPTDNMNYANALAWGELWQWLGSDLDWEIADDLGIDIPTLEGVMHAKPGDWIIKGVQGEFYPCKPDIFLVTYEPADA